MKTQLTESIYSIQDAELETPTLTPPSSSIQLSTLGRVTQITVNGAQVMVINPRVVDQLEQQVRDLLSRLTQMQEKLQRMQQQQQTQTGQIARLERDLGNKISYD